MRANVEPTVRAVITAGVGTIGAAVGFTHTHDWAVANGQSGWIAWAVAVVVESMALVAYLELRRQPGLFPALVLVGAFLMQMAAQVASAPRTAAGWLIAATPALGFLLIVKLVMRRASEPVPVEEPAVVAAHQAQAVRVDESQVLRITPSVPTAGAAVATSWPPAS